MSAANNKSEICFVLNAVPSSVIFFSKPCWDTAVNGEEISLKKVWIINKTTLNVWQNAFRKNWSLWVTECADSPGASASFRDFGVLAVQAHTVTGECQHLLNPSGVSFNMSGLLMGFGKPPVCPHTSPSTHPPPTCSQMFTQVKTSSKTGLVVTDASLLYILRCVSPRSVCVFPALQCSWVR